jgi:hypothetical protein
VFDVVFQWLLLLVDAPDFFRFYLVIHVSGSESTVVPHVPSIIYYLPLLTKDMIEL